MPCLTCVFPFLNRVDKSENRSFETVVLLIEAGKELEASGVYADGPTLVRPLRI